MEDIFNIDLIIDENQFPLKITKNDFIEETRLILQTIFDGYKNNLEFKFNEDDESEENNCFTCNGYGYICENGVSDIDCPSCKGTGASNERILNKEKFIEFIENDIIFGDNIFLELLDCEIIDTN